MHLKKKNLINILISLGAHIGHKRVESLSKSHKYILGIYKNRYIINANYIIFFLNKSIQFVSLLGSRNKNILFHINSLFLHDFEIKLTFQNLIYFKNHHSFLDEFWYPNTIVNLLNYRNVFKRLFIKIKKRRIKPFKWFEILIKVFNFTYVNRIFGIPFKSFFKKIIKLWKFYYFFKFYINYNYLPDIFCYFNTLELRYPIAEILKLKIPIISTCDTNMEIKDITYPVLINDKSILLNYFLVKLFINAFKEGKKRNNLY